MTATPPMLTRGATMAWVITAVENVARNALNDEVYGGNGDQLKPWRRVADTSWRRLRDEALFEL